MRSYGINYSFSSSLQHLQNRPTKINRKLWRDDGTVVANENLHHIQISFRNLGTALANDI
jgi:hypothetical protein